MKDIEPGWAWTAYQPSAQQPWSLALAGHLHRRAGFGAKWSQLQQALADGPQRTIDRLVRPAGEVAAFNRTCDEFEAGVGESNSAEELQAWWLRRMIATPHPLLERMTLFWHHHFATSNRGVQSGRLMRQHVQRLRQEALGSYRALLKTMSLDPALLLWLGASANRKAMPSEHFARSFLETGVLGQGQFSQQDARELARVYTGWFVLQGQLRYLDREHDAGNQEILAEHGHFKVEEVVELALKQPTAARYIVRQLYSWLISEMDDPEAPVLEPLVEFFRKDYQILPLVERMLRSNLFFTAYRRRIKSPVEFALGLVIGLEGMVSTTHLAADLAGLGQNLLHPPTPQGWAGGQYWLNQGTLAGRHRLAVALSQGAGPYADGLQPAEIARKNQRAEHIPAFLCDLFMQGDLETPVREALSRAVEANGRSGDRNAETDSRRWVQALAMLPEFQLA